MNQNEMREAFENAYTLQFPLLAVNKQNGFFYGHTEEHYRGYQAATAAAEAKYLPVIEKLVEALEKLLFAKSEKERWGKESQAYLEAKEGVWDNASRVLALAAPYLPAKE